MSRFGNLRGGPDGRMTANDEACWNELIAQAEAAAASAPSKATSALARVAHEAKNACAPGVVTRSNPCVQLSRLSRRYCAETTAGRRDLQGPLKAAAQAAREALAGHQGAAGRRQRKDIDG
ncbi:hypothetical protein [Brevundimonas naejangsanensis]|uniref:hypothetical protein n=1 Tax=Brevundimonas naejangsanensis TaxID=588932 RepID=UPI0026ED7AA3|nr:hypothetical protein [Brevundimonas naejangsanensis]